LIRAVETIDGKRTTIASFGANLLSALNADSFSAEESMAFIRKVGRVSWSSVRDITPSSSRSSSRNGHVGDESISP
jgi:hypothetical protein